MLHLPSTADGRPAKTVQRCFVVRIFNSKNRLDLRSGDDVLPEFVGASKLAAMSTLLAAQLCVGVRSVRHVVRRRRVKGCVVKGNR